MAIQFRRGTSTKRASSTEVLSSGQPFFEKDTKKLYVGDGTSQLKSLSSIGGEDIDWDNLAEDVVVKPSTFSDTTVGLMTAGYAQVTVPDQNDYIAAARYKENKISYNSSINGGGSWYDYKFPQASGDLLVAGNQTISSSASDITYTF